MGSQFSSIFPINVINAAVSADRAMLDNQIGIKFEFLRLAPHEAHGKTVEKKKERNTVETKRGMWLCQRKSLLSSGSLRAAVLPTPTTDPVMCSSAFSVL